MDQDPFKRPDAKVDDAPLEPRAFARAVITGVAIDLIGTLVLSLVLSVGYGLLLGAEGFSADEVKAMLTAPDPYSAFGWLAALLGGAVSVFAGYASTAVARRASYLPAAAVAAISILLGIGLGSNAYDSSALAFFSMLSIGCYLIGAWIYVRDPG